MGGLMSADQVPGEKRKWPSSEDDDFPENKKQKCTSKKNLCPVCLDDLNTEDSFATPCAHLYHIHCILQSYEFSNRCPICRTIMEDLMGYPYSGPSADDGSPPPSRRASTRRSRAERRNRRSQGAPIPSSDGGNQAEQQVAQGTNRGGREPSTSARRNRDHRATRGQRVPTPYPSDTEEEPQLAQGANSETELAPSQSHSQAGDAQREDATYQVEYSPNSSDAETAEVEDVEDTSDPDYVPHDSEAEAEVSLEMNENTDEDAPDSQPESETSSVTSRYMLNESPDAPPTEDLEDDES